MYLEKLKYFIIWNGVLGSALVLYYSESLSMATRQALRSGEVFCTGWKFTFVIRKKKKYIADFRESDIVQVCTQHLDSVLTT